MLSWLIGLCVSWVIIFMAAVWNVANSFSNFMDSEDPFMSFTNMFKHHLLLAGTLTINSLAIVVVLVYSVLLHFQVI